MTQRSMVMNLFVDYCDAKFYHNFEICSNTDLPYLSDDFNVILKKLSDIKWNIYSEKPSGLPTIYKGHVAYIYDDENNSKHNYSMPITIFKEKK